MNNINYVFFEEYKKPEKLCQEMYNSNNGVTNYIDDMKAASYSNYCNIPNWEADLNQLKRLRHIRNNLAHVEGAFTENVCTQNDVEWVQAFTKRILNQSDPLAVQYRNSKVHSKMPRTIPHNNQICNEEDNEERTLMSRIIITFVIIVILILCGLIVLIIQ